MTGARAADAAAGRAEALAGGRDGARAWEDFARKFPRDARASRAWLSAARERRKFGDDQAALRDYARARGAPERAAALYESGRLEETLRRRAAAEADYAALRALAPAYDSDRVAGLLRLALMLELDDKPALAAPLYADVAAHAAPGSRAAATASARLSALSAGGVVKP